jgi:hypothetical protein
MAEPQSHANQRARPHSFSESHIQLPRILSNQKPLLLTFPIQSQSSQAIEKEDDTLGLPWEPPDLPTVTSRNSLVPPSSSGPLSLNSPPAQTLVPSSPAPISKTARAHVWMIRFILHLVLISAFETLFFWKYVAPSEDTALTGLVNTYTSAAFGTCNQMSPAELNLTNAIFNTLINTTTTLEEARVAAASRATDNDVLYRNSWLYFGALMTLFGFLASTAHLRRISLHWGSILGENLALVTLLGLYEFMFFHTVAFRYRAVSADELDGMVVTEFTAAC